MFNIYLPKPIERKIQFFKQPGLVANKRLPGYGAIQVEKEKTGMANMMLWIDGRNQRLQESFFQKYALPSKGFNDSIDRVEQYLTPAHEAYCAFHLQWFFWEKYVKTVWIYWDRGLITIKPDGEAELLTESISSDQYGHALNAFYFLYPMLQDLAMFVPENEWIPVQWGDVLDAFKGERSWPSILPERPSTNSEHTLFL